MTYDKPVEIVPEGDYTATVALIEEAEVGSNGDLYNRVVCRLNDQAIILTIYHRDQKAAAMFAWMSPYMLDEPIRVNITHVVFHGQTFMKTTILWPKGDENVLEDQ